MSSERWVFDPQFSTVWFRAADSGASQGRGTFRCWSGHVDIGSDGLAASTVEVAVEAGSLDTGDAALDAIATGPAFFDAERYPTISFGADEVAVRDSHHMRLLGLLRIRDITRPVAVDVTWRGEVPESDGSSRLGFEAAATVSRKDFGLGTSALAGTAAEALLGDSIDLTFEIEAVSASKEQPAG